METLIKKQPRADEIVQLLTVLAAQSEELFAPQGPHSGKKAGSHKLTSGLYRCVIQ